MGSILAATAPGDLWTAWSPDPIALTGAVVAIAFFLHGWRRLHRRRPELAPVTRIPLFVGGVVLVLIGLLSPLDAIAEEYLQSAHMLQHVLVADAGIALTLVAVRGPLAFFFLPRDLLIPLCPDAPAARVARLPPAATRCHPALARTCSWSGTCPAAYEAALRNPLVHRLEHLSFVVVGLLVWTLIVDPTRQGRLTVGERIGVVALLFWAGQLLAYVMVFSASPFYETYVDAPRRLFGLSAVTDQKLAGVVMMVEQALTLGIAFALLVGLNRREGERPTTPETPSEPGPTA